MNNRSHKKQYTNEDAGATIQLAIAAGAIVFSLLLHFLGIASIQGLQITLFENANIPKVDLDTTMPPITVDIDKSQDLIEAENIKIAEAIAGEDKAEDYSETPQPVPESVFQAKNVANRFLPGTGSKTVELDEIDVKPNIEMWLPRIDVVEIDRKAVEDIDVADISRVVVPKIERFENAPDVVFQTPRIDANKKLEFAELPSFVPSAKSIPGKSIDDYIKEANQTATIQQISDEALANPENTKAIVERTIDVPEPEVVPVPIENVLTPEITVFKPGFLSSDDYVYFRVDISRKDETSLPVINRDVLFLQDASESIGALRIGIVRDNLKNLVGALQPTDRFNIMAFNDESSLCFPHGWMSAGEQGAKVMANQFIDNIQAKGNTDIYRAIEEVLELPTDPNRVLLVILLTDGSTTSGKITQDTEIISSFSQMNGGNASVFSISPGRKGNNDYLLSMLSFLNRGGPARIVKDRFETKTAAMNVFSTTARPVLADISFIFDSLSQAEVAPRNTPHLYLDTPLYIYGRVKKDVESVTFQAKGKSHSKIHDMIFELKLDGSGVKKGDSIIRKEWARARMFDLFVAYEKTKSPMLVQEMKKLSKDYDVAIPFEERFN